MAEIFHLSLIFILLILVIPLLAPPSSRESDEKSDSDDARIYVNPKNGSKMTRAEAEKYLRDEEDRALKDCAELNRILFEKTGMRGSCGIALGNLASLLG
ncbi:hypothetical protein DdX_10241 [Ditylenchus destructor]|uniref:Uncharacterized protein n=1 Tax=Ditylenchus destructor TaxID=166010 RepID=A0AAD4R2F5_9BILA|nr:hypothetical protein DdX_10241 [Ditylenchus destructor]